jgi:O-antigen ligase
MKHHLAALWRWRTTPIAAGLILGLMAILLAMFYRPLHLVAPLLGIDPVASFTLPIAAVLLGMFGLLALARPDLALLFVILTAPLTYRSRGFWDGSYGIANKYVPLHEFVLLIVLGATLVYVLFSRPRPAPSRQLLRSLLLPALWLAAGTVGVLIATPQGRGEAWREWRWMIVEPLLFYGLILFWASRARASFPLAPQRPLLWAAGLAGVGVALIGLLQRRGIDWSPTEGAGQCFSDFVIDTGGAIRTSSVYCHPNNLALWLDRVWPIALVLLIGALVQWRRQGGPLRFSIKATLLPLAYAAVLGITALSMLLTYSKGSRYAGAAVLLGLSLLPRRWWITAATVLLLGGGLAYSSLYGSERLQVSADTSEARLSIWRSSSAMLADHPLTGVGLDQFFIYFKQYIEPELQSDEAEKNTSHPHNLVLDLLLRVGPFGALVFAGLVWRSARRGWRLWRSDLGERWLALAALAGGAAGLLHGMVDQGYFSTDLALFTWMLLGSIDALWLGWRSQPLAGADSAV